MLCFLGSMLWASLQTSSICTDSRTWHLGCVDECSLPSLCHSTKCPCHFFDARQSFRSPPAFPSMGENGIISPGSCVFVTLAEMQLSVAILCATSHFARILRNGLRVLIHISWKLTQQSCSCNIGKMEADRNCSSGSQQWLKSTPKDPGVLGRQSSC